MPDTDAAQSHNSSPVLLDVVVSCAPGKGVIQVIAVSPDWAAAICYLHDNRFKKMWEVSDFARDGRNNDSRPIRAISQRGFAFKGL